MIIYHHPTASLPPAWLTGAEDVNAVACVDGYLFGAGPTYLLGVAGREQAKPLDDDWSVWVNGDVCPGDLMRPCPWASIEPATDLQGRTWAVPVVLGANGKPCIKVAYGDDWLPAYTPEQERILAVATAARAALEAAYASDHQVPLDQRAACAWAAEALAITNAVTVKVIRRLSLLDDNLVAGVLLHLTGYAVPSEAAHGPG